MRLLLTRPRADSEPLAATLRAAGHRCQVSPLLEVTVDRAAALPLEDVQALLITSANGIRALEERPVPRDLPVYAVGHASARAAQEAGFHHVHSADGTVEDLARLVSETGTPENGRLLHVAGSAVAGDLAGALGRNGYEVRRAVLYEARTADHLDADLLAALDSRQIDGALFFSPRTITTFVRLLTRAGREATARSLVLFALSSAVAMAGAPLVWRQIVVARHPRQDDLLAAVEEFRDSHERS